MKINDKNSIYEALVAGRVKTLTVSMRGSEDKRIRDILELARELDVPTNQVKIADMKKGRGRGSKSTRRPADIEAVCEPFEYSHLDDLESEVREAGDSALVVALDHIQDPMNLGAILRTAAAAGATGVIIEKNRCCDVTETVYETSCGGADRVRVVKVSNLRNSLAVMKKWGCWIAGTDERAKENFYEQDLAVPLVIVMGSEGDGLSHVVSGECDFVLRIPTIPEFPSLNVSVSTGVLVFEAMKQKLVKAVRK